MDKSEIEQQIRTIKQAAQYLRQTGRAAQAKEIERYLPECED